MSELFQGPECGFRVQVKHAGMGGDHSEIERSDLVEEVFCRCKTRQRVLVGSPAAAGPSCVLVPSRVLSLGHSG